MDTERKGAGAANEDANGPLRKPRRKEHWTDKWTLQDALAVERRL